MKTLKNIFDLKFIIIISIVGSSMYGIYISMMKTIDKVNLKNIAKEVLFSDFEDKLESLQNVELKESIRKLNMDVDAMRGSLEIFENKVGNIEEKFKRNF